MKILTNFERVAKRRLVTFALEKLGHLCDTTLIQS